MLQCVRGTWIRSFISLFFIWLTLLYRIDYSCRWVMLHLAVCLHKLACHLPDWLERVYISCHFSRNSEQRTSYNLIREHVSQRRSECLCFSSGPISQHHHKQVIWYVIFSCANCANCTASNCSGKCFGSPAGAFTHTYVLKCSGCALILRLWIPVTVSFTESSWMPLVDTFQVFCVCVRIYLVTKKQVIKKAFFSEEVMLRLFGCLWLEQRCSG